MLSSYPLGNVWIGVTAENQQWADIRIPALLATPAAIRFVSAEPMIGPIILSHMDVEGRTPGMYQINALTGRNTDMGRPCPDVASLDWVICGGESGPKARPLHPDWARSLRDQCVNAGVAFHFKQWGEWGPLAPLDKQGQLDYRGCHMLANDGTLYRPGDLVYPDGPRRGDAIRADHGSAHLTTTYRVGKRTAGRDLDGRVWGEYPRPDCGVAPYCGSRGTSA